MQTVGQFDRRWRWLFKLLSKLMPSTLDSVYQRARALQHRKEDHWFINKRTNEWQQCRMESTAWDDPIMQESGCSGEFTNDFRRKDLHDGCPVCTSDVMENASEPDVMARWGFR